MAARPATDGTTRIVHRLVRHGSVVPSVILQPLPRGLAPASSIVAASQQKQSAALSALGEPTDEHR
jgi:hypothetical protein